MCEHHRTNFYFNDFVNDLSENITDITFGYSFNKNVDNLPKSLINIKFGYYFNQSVDNLPETLKSIIFGTSFNKSVDNLPKYLINIKFGYYFNRSVKKLPMYLKYITFYHLKVTVKGADRISRESNYSFNLKNINYYVMSFSTLNIQKLPYGCKIILIIQ